MPIDLTLGRVPSPLGDILIASDAGDCLWAVEYSDDEARLHHLLARRTRSDGYHLTPGAPPVQATQALEAYFTGDLTLIDDLEVRLNGTDFQNSAWVALRLIPAGRPASYGEQATRIGNPRAARAVGGANHVNPYSIVVPCHRVIGTTGALTGYAGGLARKRWLLDHEARHCGLMPGLL